jgi:hypothetical protein
MAITAHVTENFGATTPTGGYTNESSHDDTVKKYEALDESGVKQRLRAGKHIETEVNISGKGGADYSVIAPGAFTEDAFKALSAETTEYHEGEYCDFNVSGKIHSNVAAP